MSLKHYEVYIRLSDMRKSICSAEFKVHADINKDLRSTGQAPRREEHWRATHGDSERVRMHLYCTNGFALV